MNRIPTFGEYLAENGALSWERLLETLMDQIREMPSITEIVHREELIPARKMVEILAVQSEAGIDFISACRQTGHWNDDIQKKVSSALESARTPLVQALVAKSDLSFEELNKLLDAYLTDRSSTPETEAPPSGLPPAAPTGEVPVAVSEFCEQFSESVRDSLRNLLAGPPAEVDRENAIAVLHRISGAARFARLERLTGGLQSLETSVRDLVSGGGAELGHLASVLDELWALRGHVAVAGVEDGYALSGAGVSDA